MTVWNSLIAQMAFWYGSAIIAILAAILFPVFAKATS